MYKNHQDLAVAIKESGVPRAELWVTSKVNTKVHKGREGALNAVRESVRELNLDQIDLMLISYRIPFEFLLVSYSSPIELLLISY